MGLFDAVKRIFAVEGAEYRCHACGRTFRYGVELPDLNCPYCDSPNIERLSASDETA